MASITSSAGSGASGTISGFGGVAWSGTGNITNSDNSYAYVNLSDTNTSSQSLEATGFNFNIPLNSTIDGVVCTFERKASADSVIRENHVYLINSGSVIGNNKIVAPGYWLTTEGAVSFGSPSDIWGATLTPSVVSSSSFGVLIDAQYYSAYSGTETAYVDQVYITIYYTTSFLCKFGTTSVGKIYYGSNLVSRVYYGSIRVM